MEEDTCRFQTQSLEFWQSKEILEMHMRLVHGLRVNKCDDCERDTKVDTEIIDNGAISDNLDEAICEIKQYSDEGKAITHYST